MVFLRSPRIKKQEGFALLQVLIVIAIIVILSVVVLANVNQGRKIARDAVRLHDITEIAQAIDLYYINGFGEHPPSLNLISSHPSTLSAWNTFLASLGLVSAKDPLNGQLIAPASVNPLWPTISVFNYIFVYSLKSEPIVPVVCARLEAVNLTKIPNCNGNYGDAYGGQTIEPFSADNNMPPKGCRVYPGDINLDTIYGKASWVCIQTGPQRR